ncbi:MAG: restriction endonuclease subunit S [Bacteroidales bacterium]|nr:restriction endonuclease subunit S [Bacteroidales bacterium]
MSKAEYKRLGDYIREVNVRNRELKVTKLVGLTIDKAFIPSVANVIGTDLSNYKVIQREQFACSLMQVSRDGKMPVAMFEEDEAIMSPAYPMFEVIDKTVLMPQYLMMWFSRSEFDREASYYAVGGVRGSLTWEDFCNMKLPIPSITRQREIVSEYETLTNRIRLNNQMIQHLEATAQALYCKTFVDNIDKENLPEGWRMGTIGEILEKFIRGPFGSALKKEDMQAGGIPVYEQQHVIDEHIRFRYYISEAKYESLKRFTVKKNDLVISCSGTIGKIKHISDNDPAGIINQALLILRVNIHKYSPILLRYFLLSGEGHNMLLEDAHGSAQINIAKKEVIESIPILIPKNKILNEIDGQLKIIDCRICLYKQENSKLTELQSLLLSKMGQ